ncbi:MAG: hypothetical protein HY438_02385 [DPANN group archaeon]|nr:hypothetical protein [DPANN group archaeon]
MFGQTVKLRMPIFGIDTSGKTYFITALCDWIINKRLGYISDGEKYIAPRIEMYKRGEPLPKTDPASIHPVTLYIYPGRITPTVNRPVELTIFDISGEDYAPKVAATGWKAPSPFFFEQVTKADIVVAMIDLVRNQRRLLTPKPASEAAKYRVFCHIDGSSTNYNEKTGFFECLARDRTKTHEVYDANLELQLYMPPRFCMRDGMPAPFHSNLERYVCDSCGAQTLSQGLPPGKLNWSNETLNFAADQGMRLNGAIDALWQNSTFLSRLRQKRAQFALAFSKSDAFDFIPERQLESLVDAYFSVAKTRMSDAYRLFKVSSTNGINAKLGGVPEQKGFEQVLEYAFNHAV